MFSPARYQSPFFHGFLFFQKQPTPMLCSLLGTVSQGVMPSSAQKQVGDQGHSILWVRILKGTAQWWLGPLHPCDCCTRNGLICSCIPHSQGHSVPALAEGCSFRLPLWAVSFPSAQGGGCGGVPSDPLSWATVALALRAHSQGPPSACPQPHRTPSPGLGSRPGHSLQGYKDLALLAQPGLPSRASQVQSSPSDQRSLLLQLQLSFFSPPPSLPRGCGSCGHSQQTCCLQTYTSESRERGLRLQLWVNCYNLLPESPNRLSQAYVPLRESPRAVLTKCHRLGDSDSRR